MFGYEKFEMLTKTSRDLIIQQSFKEKETGLIQMHSINSIIDQGRDIAIGSRMTSKPMKWRMFQHLDGNLVDSENVKKYSGKDIAQIFIDSAKLNGKTFYPIAGDWRNLGVNQLVLFVKNGQKYLPYARFDVKSIQIKSRMSPEEMTTLVDVTPLAYCTYKSILEIELRDESNLPEDYIGNRSGTSIYCVAFKGSSPNILII